MDSAAAFPSRLDEGYGTEEVTPIDLSHHLSELSKSRRFSPLKSFAKYSSIPGIISLAGGLPDPNYFPLDSLGGSLLATDTFSTDEPVPEKKGWFTSWFGGSPSKPALQQITIPKFVKEPTRGSLQVSTALQYGSADGLLFLQNWIKQWMTLVSPPAYEGWAILLDDGATDGWHKVIEMLCNPGDPILVEAWTYPSAIEAGWPMGARPVPVPIDGDGLIPEALDTILSKWNVEEKGCKKPTVLYTVPVGQNPTGSIVTNDRRRKIYAVCVKHDVIICEDDPYYILQFPYSVPDQPSTASSSSSLAEDNRRFLKSLSPSYLRFDYQGRVIRMDTFSKTIAPGCRLGWTTANPLFSERLLRASETSTQQPSGFSQVIISKMLETWGMDGWVRWLRGIRSNYRERSEIVVDELSKGFKVETVRSTSIGGNSFSSSSRAPKMVGYGKYSSAKRTPVRTADLDEKFANLGLSESRPPLISFFPPEAGMFVWVSIHVKNHKRFNTNASPEERRKMTRDLMNDLWELMAGKNLLVAPGWMFNGDGLRAGAPDQDKTFATRIPSISKEDKDYLSIMNDAEDGVGHFRVSYSFVTHEKLREGIVILCKSVTQFFE